MISLLLSSALLISGAQGFAPVRTNLLHVAKTTGPLRVLPSGFQDVVSSFTLADALEGVSEAAGDAIQGVSDAAGGAMQGVSDMAGDVIDAVPKDDNGWFGFLTGPIEGLLGLIHSASVAVGVDANAWGISIIVLTLLIKLLTFPLTKSQLESTSKMQAMAPAVKEIQAKYQSNPEVMNQKVAEFYQINEINPLAGCIPSLVQIPVFIGLYRAVLNLAKENKLDEPFLFLPNLEGPTYGADPAHGSDWLFQGWTESGPPLGWEDTIAFLILPVLLVVSQFLAMELMQPKTADGAQQQNNVVLKILPVLIGWFALNVPAALSVYWFVNNIVTTTISVAVRSSVKFEPIAAGGAAVTSIKTEPTPTLFTPLREKPAGFGQAQFSSSSIQKDAVKPITVIDAEVEEDDDDEVEERSPGDATSGSETKPKKKARRTRKKKN